MSERMSEERLKELATAASRVIAEPQRHSASQWNAAKAVSECVCEIGALRAELAEARAKRDEYFAQTEKLADRGFALCDRVEAAERERDRARADALEEAAKVCDAEFDKRNANMARADAGSLETMSIVERMARAIAKHVADDDTNWSNCVGEARAALRAIKPEDVSDGQLDAFWAIHDKPPNHGETTRERDARAIAAAIAAGPMSASARDVLKSWWCASKGGNICSKVHLAECGACSVCADDILSTLSAAGFVIVPRDGMKVPHDAAAAFWRRFRDLYYTETVPRGFYESFGGGWNALIAELTAAEGGKCATRK